MQLRSPRYTLFPYTTLFRSQPDSCTIPATAGLRIVRAMESVERETFLPAEPDEVWGSVSDLGGWFGADVEGDVVPDRKSTRLNSSHVKISYAVFCLKKKKQD